MTVKFGMISFAHGHADSYAEIIKGNSSNGEGETKDPLSEIVAISDNDERRGLDRSKKFGCKYFRHYEEMLENVEIDAVVIASENSMHKNQVVASARARKHILCEKPIAITIDQLSEMKDELEKNNVIFQTAFVMRYASPVLEACSILKEGKLGEIKAISATNHGKYPGGWFGKRELSGGGAIMDHTVHVADLIRLFTGDDFGQVRASSRKNLRSELVVEDVGLLYAKMKKTGIPVSIDCSWSRPDAWPIWGDLIIELVCEKGVLKIDCFRPHMDVALNGGSFFWKGVGEDYNEKMISSFCDSIERKKLSSIGAGFDDGAKAVLVALAAYSSLNRESSYVDLPSMVTVPKSA